MSDASMVERVAKAICASYCREGEAPDLFWKGNEENHRRTARAAIAAMREPTNAMREVCSFETAEVEYPAMIDAALAADSQVDPPSARLAQQGEG